MRRPHRMQLAGKRLPGTRIRSARGGGGGGGDSHRTKMSPGRVKQNSRRFRNERSAWACFPSCPCASHRAMWAKGNSLP